MKLISLNIELNRHHELVLPFLKKEKADVVCLQELLEDDFEMYKRELGMQGVHRLTSYINDSIHIESKRKREGIAIFANNIINSGYIFHVGKVQDIERTFEEYIKDKNILKNRALVWIETKNDKGEIFKFINSHLTITHHGEVTRVQIEDNIKFINNAKSLGEFVFSGDTNAPRGSQAFDKISEVFKDNIPYSYKSSLDPNIHRAKGVELMVDCLFTTTGYKASCVELKGGISDHMAVVALIDKI